MRLGTLSFKDTTFACQMCITISCTLWDDRAKSELSGRPCLGAVDHFVNTVRWPFPDVSSNIECFLFVSSRSSAHLSWRLHREVEGTDKISDHSPGSHLQEGHHRHILLIS